jgi:8-oxo-dGTP pyrophosphatase MutT (NUDIX family)
VFIVYKDKVLLRLHDKYKEWYGVGGHIELDEDPAEAAVREVKEEVGLDVDLIGGLTLDTGSDKGYRELLPPKYMNRHDVGQGHEHVSLVYFGKSTTDAVVPESSGDEWRWLNSEEIEKGILPLKDNIRAYALAALAEIGE